MSGPVTPGSSQEGSVDKRCDFLSEDFDPLAALTTLDDSYVPSPEIAPFSNLEEYTNAVKGLTAAQRKKKAAASKASSSSKPSERQWERIIKPDILKQAGIVRKEDIAESMMIKGRRKMKKDIFQRLEGLSLSSGPQSVLHKAMKERIQVKVWTRSARQLRGFSVGFILAFDKHWNLAMVDVDETYCQPSLPRTSFTLPKQVMLQMKREQKVKEQGSSRSSTPVLSESKSRPTTPLPTESKSRPTTPVPNEPTASKADSTRTKVDPTKSRDSAQPQKFTPAFKNGDSERDTRTSKLPSDKSKCSRTEDSETFVVPGSKGYGDTGKLKTLPRFPRGIAIKEKIPGLQGRIFVRHLNQLFVRGDNIVMVQLLS